MRTGGQLATRRGQRPLRPMPQWCDTVMSFTPPLFCLPFSLTSCNNVSIFFSLPLPRELCFSSLSVKFLLSSALGACGTIYFSIANFGSFRPALKTWLYCAFLIRVKEPAAYPSLSHHNQLLNTLPFFKLWGLGFRV